MEFRLSKECTEGRRLTKFQLVEDGMERREESLERQSSVFRGILSDRMRLTCLLNWTSRTVLFVAEVGHLDAVENEA